MKPGGVFIAVVGPSGAGKDSLIAFVRTALAGESAFVFPTRVITRNPDATEASVNMSVDTFLSAQQTGAFALHWAAHGLHYGLPVSLQQELAQGRHVIANISRGSIAEARQRFIRIAVVHITADPDILRARLQIRGRESNAEQDGRIKHNTTVSPSFDPDLVVANNGALADAGAVFLNGLRRIVSPHNHSLEA